MGIRGAGSFPAVAEGSASLDRSIPSSLSESPSASAANLQMKAAVGAVNPHQGCPEKSEVFGSRKSTQRREEEQKQWCRMVKLEWNPAG